MDAEIFGTLLEEARAAFDEEVVIELSSENSHDIDGNCERIALWVENWKKSRRQSAE